MELRKADGRHWLSWVNGSPLASGGTPAVAALIVVGVLITLRDHSMMHHVGQAQVLVFKRFVNMTSHCVVCNFNV